MNSLSITQPTQISLPTPQSRADAVRGLEVAMMALPGEEMPPCEHIFTPGFYSRIMRIPAGTLVVGKSHKEDHWFFLLEGVASYISEEGEGVVTAGAGKWAKAGVKRAVMAITDCVFMNIFSNPENLTDVNLLEDILTQEGRGCAMERMRP